MSAAPDATILVVDDDDGNRYFKSHVLRRAGYRVCEAARGDDGLWQVEREQPDVVLLDVRLPDASGFDVCRAIKAKHPSMLVLQTSAAFTDTRDRAAGLEGGADSYLVEPIEDTELIAVVQALLRLHEAKRELRRLNETLEQRVAERTRELAEANRRLDEEATERAKAEEALRHAEKLDALGQLTGGVAHDFNNLLTVVVGNLDLVERVLGASPPPVEQLAKLVGTARDAALDCERLTSRLLAFARRDALRPEIVVMNAVVTRFLPLLQRALGEHVAVELSLEKGLWPCRVDPKQFETALLNLALNARDAMPAGGAIRIATSNLTLSAGTGRCAGAHPPAGLAPGAYVRLSVIDTGTGMGADVLAHVFEPFFTTKDVGQGSGLGLSQVYGFAKQSGGHVAIESAPDQGTRVDLFLPRTADAPTREAEEDAAPSALPRGSETILIVEDNDMVLEFTSALLTELGYRVLFAGDGPSALDVIEREPDIDLLFTDVVMPNRMSGIELAHTARRARPGIKVLITSGYSAHRSDGAPTPGEFPTIAKPYRSVELAARLRAVLDA